MLAARQFGRQCRIAGAIQMALRRVMSKKEACTSSKLQPYACTKMLAVKIELLIVFLSGYRILYLAAGNTSQYKIVLF
jgi:hypothetical protein